MGCNACLLSDKMGENYDFESVWIPCILAELYSFFYVLQILLHPPRKDCESTTKVFDKATSLYMAPVWVKSNLALVYLHIQPLKSAVLMAGYRQRMDANMAILPCGLFCND